jgi:folate-binding protein YgfZ
MSEATYVMLPERGLVTVAGEDRADFLQGLISNDITHVGPARVIWAALLTPQGKYLHDFFVAELEHTIYLDCEADRLMDLGQRLSRYKLRARIELGMADNFVVAVMPGTAALNRLGLTEEPGAAAAFGGGIVYADPRLAQAGARAILPKGSAEGALRDAGFTAGDRAEYDMRRLALGLSDGSRDLVVEKSILLESNFDELHGVDWDKGCYMGQELTARTKYRGLIKKRLMPVDIDGDIPPPGTPVTLAGKDVGELRSARDGKGLALLRLEQVERVMAGDGEFVSGAARLTPRKPDWAAY